MCLPVRWAGGLQKLPVFCLLEIPPPALVALLRVHVICEKADF